MCVHFYAKQLIALDKDIIKDNGDIIPEGTIFAIDFDGEYYQFIHHFYSDADLDPNNWPEKTEKGIKLFRDFWRFSNVKNSKTAILFKEIKESLTITIK